MGDGEPNALEGITKFFEDHIVKSAELLFEGFEAHVYKGSFGYHKNVAIKVWRTPPSSPAAISTSEAIRMYKYSHHDNIVRFFGVLVNEDQQLKGFVTEYMAGGNLSAAIHNNDLKLPYGLRMHWLLQACYALQYLHSNDIAHRDIKPHNMLLSGNLEKLKLCDLGLSKDCSIQTGTTAGGAGTYMYMAPERINKQLFEKIPPLAADIFSVSVTIWEILTRQLPANDKIGLCVFGTLVLEGRRPDISLIRDTPENREIRGIIQRGWNHSPQERPSVDELVKLFEKEKAKTNYEFSPVANYAVTRKNTSMDRTVATKSLCRVSTDVYNVLRGWDLVSPTIEHALSDMSKLLDDIQSIGIVFVTSEEEKEMDEVEERRERFYAHILAAYKDFCKKNMEEVWITEELDQIFHADDRNKSIHEELVDLLRRAWPGLLRCSIRKTGHIEEWFHEADDFIKKRRDNYEEIRSFCSSCDRLTGQAETAYDHLRAEEYEQLASMVPQLAEDFGLCDRMQAADKLQYMSYSNGELHDRLERLRMILALIDENLKNLLKKYISSINVVSEELDLHIRLYEKLAVQTILDETAVPLLMEEITRDHDRFGKQMKENEKLCGTLQKMGIDVNSQLGLGEKMQTISWQLKKLADSKEAVRMVEERLVKMNTLRLRLPLYSILHNKDVTERPKDKYQRTGKELKEMLDSLSSNGVPSDVLFSNQLVKVLKEKEKVLEEEVGQTLSLNDNVAKLFELSGWFE